MKNSRVALALFALWVVATLLFGGVAPSYLRVHTLLVALIALVAYVDFRHERSMPPYPFERTALFLFGGILAVGLVQLVPLSERLLGFLSPLAHRLTFETLRALDIAPRPEGYPVSLHPAATARFLPFAGAFLLALGAGIAALRSRERRLLFAQGICLFAALVAFFGLLHRFSGSTKMYGWFDHGWTFFGPYINRNHAGALFAVGGILALGLLQRRISTIDRWIVGFQFGLLVLGLLFTGSRASVLAFGLPALLGLVRFRRAGPALWVLAGIALLAIFWKASFFERITATAEALRAGREFRFAFWGYALSFLRQAPLLGTGFGSFGRLSPLMVGDRFFLHPEHAENDLLELFACGGLLTAALAMPLAWKFLRRISSILRSDDAPGTRRTFALALLALALNSFFNFNAPLPAHHLLAAFLMAGVLTTQGHSLFSDPFLRFVYPLLCVVVLGAGALTRDAPPPIPPLSLPAARSDSEARAARLLESAEAEFALSHDPTDARALYTLAEVSVRDGNRERARKAYERAVALSPFDLEHRAPAAAALARILPPSEGADLLAPLLSHPFLSTTQKGELALYASYAALQQKDAGRATSHLEIARKLAPGDWKLPLLEGALRSDGASWPEQARISYERFERTSSPDALWDEIFFAVSPLSRAPVNFTSIAEAIHPIRPSIGPFLETASRLGANPIALRLDRDIPSPRFRDPPQASGNVTRTPSTDVAAPEILEIHVRQAHAELDLYSLPVRIDAVPPSLSFRLFVRTTVPLSQQLALQAGGRWHLTPEPARHIRDDLWELRFPRAGEVLAKAGVTEKRIDAVGFTPLEKEGRYALGPVEGFIDSGR